MFNQKLNRLAKFLIALFVVGMAVVCARQIAESSYLPTVGSNIGIGTSTPVGGFAVMNGNVGVGTWSPTSALQVVGTVEATAFSGDGSGLTNLPASGGWTDGGTNVYTSTTTDNVGIGTTTPNAATLEIVKNAAQPAFKISSTATRSGDYFVVNSQGNVGIGTNNALGALTVMNGNVGIGTFNPQASLDLKSSASTQYATLKGSAGGVTFSSNNSVGTMALLNSSNSSVISLFNSGDNRLVGVTNADFSFHTNNAERMRIKSTGNVGIGTVDPVSQLVVSGGVGIGTLGSSSFLTTAAPMGGLIVENNVGIGTSAPVGALTVMNGNVGVGTWSPTQKLEVVGTVNATAFVGDGSGLTGLPSASGWTDGGTNVYISTTTDNVGIGTTTPNAATLEIVKNANQPLLKMSSSATGNGDYLLVNSAGNVGVGTFAPNFHLVVVEPGNAAEASSVLSSAAQLGSTISVQGDGQAYFMGRDITNNLEFIMGTSANGYAFSGAVTSHDYRIRTANTDRMSFTSGGNIGIGTVTPLDGFVVIENTSSLNSFRVNDAVIDSSPFIIDPAGNVGIGTTTSNALLNVSSTASQDLVRINDNGGGDPTPVVIDQNGNVGIGTALANNNVLTLNGGVYASGAVGVGTFTPTGMLDIRQDEVRIWTGAGTDTNATAAGELYVEGDLEVDGTIYGDGSGITSLASTLPAGGWTDGGTNVYTTTTTDNVGIGTTTPTSRLHGKTILSAATGNEVAYELDYITNKATSGNDTGLLINSTDTLSPGSSRPLLINVDGTTQFSVWNNGGIGAGGSVNAFSKYELLGGSVTLSNQTGYNMLDTASNSVALLSLSSTNNFQLAGSTVSGSHQYTNRNSTGAHEFLTGLTPTVKMIISNNGNVGIGTTTPVGGLSVMNGNVGIGTWSPTQKMQVVGTVAATAFSGDGSALTNLPSGGGWTDGGTNVYTTTTTDNVGIGTTTPNAATLEIVKNAAQPALKVSSSATGAGDFLIVNSEGNVGIGTIAPRGALSVMNGNVGIGSTNPTANLLIRASANSIRALDVVNPSGAGSFNVFYSAGGASSVNMWDQSNNLGVVLNSIGTSFFNGGNIGIGTSNPRGALTVMNGNVGIGTWSPVGALEVKATGSAQVTINGASGGCLMFRDTDNAGWTECNALNGGLTCSVDADGICDGS